MLRKQQVRLILIFLMVLLAAGVGILFLVNPAWVSVRTTQLVQQAKDLWVNATTSFPAALLQGILVAIIIAVLTLFGNKIRAPILALLRTEKEKLALKDLEAQEGAYLVDLKRRIIDVTDKMDRWNIKRYVEMNFINEDETEPELREFRWRVWKLPNPTADPDEQHLVYGEPSRQRRANLSKYLKQEHRLVLKGEPGSGKTITLRRLAMMSLEEARQDPNAPLPVLVELSQYRSVDPITNEPIDVLDFLKIYLKVIHPEATFLHADLERTLQRGTILFLFDGLNEMPPQDYLERVRKLENFSRQRRKHYFVFACRTLHYDPLLEAKTLAIMPLDDGRMRLFLHNYMENPSQADRVFHELHLAPSPMLEACRTPLILFMLSRALTFQPEMGVPRDPVSIFDAFVSQLYADNKIPEDQKNKLSQALSQMAFFMVKDRMISAAVDDTWLAKHLPYDSINIVRLYGVASGVLDHSTVHGYKFSHHMLQEFFAGRRLAEAFNQHEDIEPYLASFWWEEVILAASALVESPDDFLMATLGKNNGYVFNDILQHAMESPEGKKNLDVLKYLCQRAAQDLNYQRQVGASIWELYARVFQSGRAHIAALRLQDRRLMLCTRVIGAIRERLSAEAVTHIIQYLESRLILGDTYQRAGIIETCRYLEGKDGVRLLRWVISHSGDRHPFAEFHPADLAELPSSLLSFFGNIDTQGRLPILQDRRWLRELAFVTLTSIGTEQARSEIAQMLLTDPSVWRFVSGVIPVLNAADLMLILRQLLAKKSARNALMWFLLLAAAVALTGIFGITVVVGFLITLLPVILVGGFIIYWIYKIAQGIRNLGRPLARRSAPLPKPHPSPRPFISYSLILKDMLKLFKNLFIGSLGIIGIAIVILIGPLPLIALVIYSAAFIAFVPLAKTYARFISSRAAREELSGRIFAFRERKRLLVWSTVSVFSIPILGLLLMHPSLFAPPTWVWGLLSKWVMDQVGVTPSGMVLILISIALVITLLYSPPIIFTLYSIVGSYWQLIDIEWLRNSLMKNQAAQNYRQIDHRLAQIAGDFNRWNVARSRAIRALSQSRLANDHLPLFKKLAEQDSDVPVSVQEAAERAIYEIERRETKHISLRD